MALENGEWIMYGLRENDPACMHTAEDLTAMVERVGFLPLFRNEARGFSVEEYTAPQNWWCDDPQRDPWLWRERLAAEGRVAYGKFFDKKAGFISLAWFPAFANFRRDGYDFDARWDDELAGIRQKKIMDCFADDTKEIFSFELRKKAGFGRNGEKNFEGIVTGLQEQTYLCIRDFRRRKNKAGREYGWPITVYAMPEDIWGYDTIAAGYDEEPCESGKRILRFAKQMFPLAEEDALRKILGIR